jgi:hypothetical protein
VCGNGRDDDCNGFTDEENAKDCVPYYRDDDEDRYGVTDDFKCLCAPKAPYSFAPALQPVRQKIIDSTF